MITTIRSLAYLIASLLFIMSLRGLSTQESARRGNRLGVIGMLVAVAGIALTAINMFGGFAVTQRMLSMFRK